jgi:hypothetical protein
MSSPLSGRKPLTFSLAGAAVLVLSACAQPVQDQTIDPAMLTKADSLAGRFQAELKDELSTALSEVGPVGAIGVCQSAAPAIGDSLSRESGGEVRRIARQNRNPGNTLEPEIETLYSELEAKPMLDGTPNAVHAIRENRLLYLKAIPMQEQPCSVCHGTNIAPEVQAEIVRAYPADKATGFEPGQLRGAFLIELDLPEASQ